MVDVIVHLKTSSSPVEGWDTLIQSFQRRKRGGADESLLEPLIIEYLAHFHKLVEAYEVESETDYV